VLAHKPLLREIIDSVQAYCIGNGRNLPYLNIEIKSKAAWDGLYHPQAEDFVQAVVAVIGSSGMKERCIIQSFDERVPALVWQVDSGLQSACLVDYRRVWSRARFAEKVMGTWGKQAKVYSPHYRMLSRRAVKQMQRREVEVIPWTVNKPLMMKRLMRWKVNGLITDFPDILVRLRQTRAGQTP
jgi:glycerophosphoryl diester phosphodiesterase